MALIKTVAILGATGDLGAVLIPALLAANFHITCITRPDGTRPATFPPGVTTLTASYTDVPALTTALTSQHALVEAFNPAASTYQEPILRAALAAGVKHVITPDFSGDTFNVHMHEVELLNPKLAAQRVLEQIITESGGAMTWTGIVVGPWYDWAIEKGVFWFDREKKVITRYGSGEQRISVSRQALAGEALVAVLREPARFQNRAAYFASHLVTTNQLIGLVKELGLKSWTVKDVPMDEFAAEARRLWAQDTAAGVENRLATKAFPMMATVTLLNEGNRYGANFGDKVEKGWDEGEDALRKALKRMLS